MCNSSSVQTESDFVCVILAGGRGRRILPFSRHVPKPLLPICNKPIIQYQIDYLREIGVKKIFIVVGESRDDYKDIVYRNASSDLVIELITQKLQLGTAHALYTLRDYIEQPFYVMLGDVFIFPNPFPSLLNTFLDSGSDAVLAARIEPDPSKIRRNFTIICEKDGRVTNVIEKPVKPLNQLKGCGAYLFKQTIFDAIRRTPRTTLRDEYEITDSIQIYIDEGHRVDVWNGVEWDINLTDPKDLLVSNLRMLKQMGKICLIGSNSSMPDGIKIINSVIGSGVVVNSCESIVNSLIFDHTVTENKKNIVNAIINNKVTYVVEDLDTTAFLSI